MENPNDNSKYKSQVVGEMEIRVIDILNLSISEGTKILLGPSNIEHMKSEHPEDFEKYGDKLEEILSSPDYVAKHPKKDSIEYIKVYDGHVLVAVRISKGGKLYARTLFTMDPSKVERYKQKGALMPYKKD